MKIKGYNLKYTKKLKDIDSLGYVLEHVNTGAKVVLIKNSDKNKVFSIGFKTPPENSTGVAHILEHSVLCGSKKFPLKDPFVELVKGSLNTFLNAMTFPDKTIYPLASMNDKDFKNLMEVYLDAVFFPNIYTKKEIFSQEGWHFHLEKEEDDITYNGVVYNEMKGVYSSAENIIESRTTEVLLKDTQYGVDSGGNPNNIPELTYEYFLEFHSKYYHPSNSVIYLYGDVDFEERLEYIADNYLNKFDKKDVDSSIRLQKPFQERVLDTIEYSISNNESIDNKTYYSYNVIIGDNDDISKIVGLKILMYALISSPSSNIKKIMIEKGLASQLSYNIETCLAQPLMSIVASNAKNNSVLEFEETLNRLIKEELQKGIDKEVLLGAINIKEFAYREADFSGHSKGLFYLFNILDGMLYDENNAFTHQEIGYIYEDMRNKVGTDYFNKLAKDVILNNNFKAIIEAKPVVGLNAKKEEEIAKFLKSYKESLNKDEIKKLVEDTNKLIEFQETQPTQEELNTLPKIKKTDIEKNITKYDYSIDSVDSVDIVVTNENTNELGYINLFYEISGINDIRQVDLITKLLSKVDTQLNTYSSIKNKINLITGGIGFDITPIKDINNKLKVFLNVYLKAKEDNIEGALKLVDEVLFTSKFDNLNRIKEVFTEVESSTESEIKYASHIVASNRALSNISHICNIIDSINGLGAYDYIREVNKQLHNNTFKDNEDYRRILSSILTKKSLTVSYTGTKDGYKKNKNAIKNYINKHNCGGEIFSFDGLNVNKKEGISTSSQVQYVAVAGDYLKEGLEYKGFLKVLGTILSYEYLWENIRVKGGAYGCMSQLTAGGEGYLVSYRDPQLKKTIEVYQNLPKWLKNFKADEDRMEKYIIGTMSSVDRPLTPKLIGLLNLTKFITGKTDEMQQKERDEILSATQNDINYCAKYIEAILSDNLLCTIGNETKIEENKDIFDNIRGL